MGILYIKIFSVHIAISFHLPIYQHSHHHKSNRQKASTAHPQICHLCMYDSYTSTHTIIRVTVKKRDHLAPRFATSGCKMVTLFDSYSYDGVSAGIWVIPM